MALKNTQALYGNLSKTFHWLIFILIAAMLSLGFIMEDITNKVLKMQIYGIHKSLGITLLALIILRVIWALMNPKPKLPDTTKSWERIISRAVHILLYVVVIAMPITGIVMSTAAGRVPSFFGLFNVAAPWVPHSKALAQNVFFIHQILAWSIIALVSLHTLAAIKHHFINKDGVLLRMLPSCPHKAKSKAKLELGTFTK